MTWPAVVSSTPARVAAMLSSVATLGISPAMSMRWSRWTRSSRPSIGPMLAKTAGQARPTSASGTACSSGSATTSPRRVRAGLVTPMWSETTSADHGTWTTAVPSVTSGRVPPAVTARRAPIASLADSVEITGRRPLATPDRSTRSLRTPCERGTSSTAASWPSGTSAEAVSLRRWSGFGTTRPAHTTSVASNAASIRVRPSPTVVRLAAATGTVSRVWSSVMIADSKRSSRSATGSFTSVMPPTATGPGMTMTWSAP